MNPEFGYNMEKSLVQCNTVLVATECGLVVMESNLTKKLLVRSRKESY